VGDDGDEEENGQKDNVEQAENHKGCDPLTSTESEGELGGVVESLPILSEVITIEEIVPPSALLAIGGVSELSSPHLDSGEDVSAASDSIGCTGLDTCEGEEIASIPEINQVDESNDLSDGSRKDEHSDSRESSNNGEEGNPDGDNTVSPDGGEVHGP